MPEQKIQRQHFGRLAQTEKVNEIVDKLNPIIDMQGKKGIKITKNEGRWMIEATGGIDEDVTTVTEQRCVNGSVVERTYIIVA